MRTMEESKQPRYLRLSVQDSRFGAKSLGFRIWGFGFRL